MEEQKIEKVEKVKCPLCRRQIAVEGGKFREHSVMDELAVLGLLIIKAFGASDAARSIPVPERCPMSASEVTKKEPHLKLVP